MSDPTTSAAGPTQATTPAYIASAHHVHEATVRGGLWTARCDWSAGWSVPLIADPEAAVVFVSCPKCREIRESSQETSGNGGAADAR